MKTGTACKTALAVVAALLLMAGCTALDNPYDENNRKYTEYTLTVNDITDSGSVSRKPDKNTYKYGETVTVTAKAGTGYVFVNWSDTSMGKDTAVTVRMTKNVTLTAAFRQADTPKPPVKYKLTIVVIGEGTVSPPGETHDYDAGTSVTVTATADSGYTFDRWNGALSSTDDTVTLKMDDNKILVAIFQQQADTTNPPDSTYKLTIATTKGGTVSPSGTYYYSADTSVTVKASADSGYMFSNWTIGASTDINPTITVKMDGDKVLIASFIEKPVPPPDTTYTITFNAAGGTVSPTSGKTGTDGKLASLPAVPTREGYTFDGWFTAATEGTKVTTSTVFTKDTTIYAQWTEISTPSTYTITFDANGGMGTPERDTTGAGGTLLSLPEPTRTGYTFNGWYTAETGGTVVDTSTVFTEATTIYAQWTFESTFEDSRDNTTYKRVQIGEQVWMAENLNYYTTGSACYNTDTANCAKYGRLYDWYVAMVACPAGWHLPSDGEWTALTNFVGSMSTAGTKLKSKSGWNNKSDGNSGNGTDDVGFSALPGGFHDGNGSFSVIGQRGIWWTATGEERAGSATIWNIYHDNQQVISTNYNLNGQFSVRCVQDN